MLSFLFDQLTSQIGDEWQQTFSRCFLGLLAARQRFVAFRFFRLIAQPRHHTHTQHTHTHTLLFPSGSAFKLVSIFFTRFNVVDTPVRRRSALSRCANGFSQVVDFGLLILLALLVSSQEIFLLAVTVCLQCVFFLVVVVQFLLFVSSLRQRLYQFFLSRFRRRSCQPLSCQNLSSVLCCFSNEAVFFWS